MMVHYRCVLGMLMWGKDMVFRVARAFQLHRDRRLQELGKVAVPAGVWALSANRLDPGARFGCAGC
jgi:hypothetical protein